MVFSSLVFICIFLPLVFLLHLILPTIQMKNVVLIFASLLFYAYGEPIYVLLMIGSTIVNYILGRWIDLKQKKYTIVVAVFINLFVLGIFKYADMVVLTVNQLFKTEFATPGISLPIGISFFTFQIMSYVIDVYRKDVEVQKDYWKLLLYISFFPQLIAGPIIKYHDVELQISNRSVSAEKIAKGFRRFIVGLSKKVLISNMVALTVDQIFALELTNINIFTAWIGALAYLLQIYYDFSGYSDMAIGLGYMFGFNFMENFRYPYGSRTIQEFWRRWHISLSTWFKEYLYIPLGGNRYGRFRTCINKMIVFFSTGLWHGANWTFVVWGLYHGMFLLMEEVVPIKKLPKILGHIYTIIVVTCGFVIFRAETISQGMHIIVKMFTGFNMTPDLMYIAFRYCTPLFVFSLIIGLFGSFAWKEKAELYIAKKSESVRNRVEYTTYGIGLVLLILCMLSLSSGTYNPFIYFRF